MSVFSDSLLFVWKRNEKRAHDLLANIPSERMAEQPGGQRNHPAWTLSHLNLYHPSILSVIQSEPISDPGQLPEAAHVGNGSKPVAELSAYASREELLARFAEGHLQIERALTGAPAELFERELALERWKTAFGATATLLTYMMIYHESHHLAEIACWKKAAGLPVIA